MNSETPRADRSDSSSSTRAEQELEEGRAGPLPEQETKDESKTDVIWVEFPKGDPENPFNFSKFRKWTITVLAAFFTIEVAATASAYVPGIPQMERDLNVTNHELSLLGIAIYAACYFGTKRTLGVITLGLGAVAAADGIICKNIVGHGEWNHWGYAPMAALVGFALMVI